jgi:hypothetical protein
MTEVKKSIIEIPTEHPLEDVFGIEKGTTMMPQVQRTTEMTEAPSYDPKDNEVDGQFQEVYDAAMGAFESQYAEAEMVEGKYKARAGEVAVQFLNTALAAAQSKSTLKQHKDKITRAVAGAGPKTINNNLIVADRNELLRDLKNLNLPIDVDPIE